jgi:hypothetical protein
MGIQAEDRHWGWFENIHSSTTENGACLFIATFDVHSHPFIYLPVYLFFYHSSFNSPSSAVTGEQHRSPLSSQACVSKSQNLLRCIDACIQTATYSSSIHPMSFSFSRLKLKECPQYRNEPCRSSPSNTRFAFYNAVALTFFFKIYTQACDSFAS